jgi:hypothetical protein
MARYRPSPPGVATVTATATYQGGTVSTSFVLTVPP